MNRIEYLFNITKLGEEEFVSYRIGTMGAGSCL